MPPLPGKALKRQLPFRGDEGIFEESFIEERRVGLEQFINRLVVETTLNQRQEKINNELLMINNTEIGKTLISIS